MALADHHLPSRRLAVAGLVLLAWQLLGALLPSTYAQSNWAQIPPTVSANLWGACYGGGQFVAVGERGTILTSPDGLAWTPRTSGTTAWLTSVAYGFNHYVAVGADRTILSSLDGITWETIASFPTNTPRERLNVVGFDHDRFLAYGEHDFALELELPARIDWRSPYPSTGLNTWWRGFASGLGHCVVVGEAGLIALNLGASPLNHRYPVVIPPSTRALSGIVFDHGTFTAVGEGGVILTSSDALTWSLQSSGTTLGLNAVAPFNNTLITVGAGGVILVQSQPLTWTPRLSPTSELLLALAASDTAAIAVGGSGTIIRSTAAAQAPTLIASPVSVTETLTGAASFVVRTSGSLPLSYQWSRNGTALADETNAELILPSLTAADAASYTVKVANSVGTVTSDSVTLTLLPAPRLIIDSSFRADASLTGSPVALLALPDGSVLVANGKPNQLVKLTPAGALDPTWPVNTFSPSAGNFASAPKVLVPLPDGRVLVGGSFATHNAQPRPNLIRLNRDGTYDATFIPAPEATARPILSLALQPDGKVVLANGSLAPVRLLADGRLDSSFQPQPLPPVGPPDIYESRSWFALAVDVSGDGKIFTGYQVSLTATVIAPRAAATVVRFLPDGTLDPTFAAPRSPGRFTALRALDDGGLLWIGGEPIANDNGAYNARIARLRRDGTPFPGHLFPLLPPLIYSFLYSDGRFIALTRDPSSLKVLYLSPVRYNALGAIDPLFTGGIGYPRLFAPTTDDRLFVAGDFTVYHGAPANRVARLNSVADDTLNAPRILSFSVDKSTVAVGETLTVRAAVTGSGPLTYDWTGAPGVSQPDITRRTTSPILRLPLTSMQDPWVQLTVRNTRGQATSARLELAILPDTPAILAQPPTRVSAQTGRTLTLTVSFNGQGRIEYEWRRNGQPVSGPAEPYYTPAFLTIPAVTSADAGTYTVLFRNTLGTTVTSTPIVVTVDDTSRFTNLSTRAFIGSGDQSAIVGFVLSGGAPRTVLLRGIGPGLAPFGVTAPLADPQLTLFDRDGATDQNRKNNDWSSNADSGAFLLQRFSTLGAFPLNSASKDAALLVTLAPGTYTVQLSGAPGQTGTALLELYEADNDAARILNLSTRALVTPAAPAFAGFAIRGPVAKTVLVRAAGPALAAFGIANPLARPRLTVRDSDGRALATNSSWETAPDRPALLRATQSVGAFPFAAGSNDSALLLTLPPGNYTAVIESPDTTGVALVEVYEVP